MEKPNQKKEWATVPRFGGWDHKTANATNYSMVFTQARANRKQRMADGIRASLGDEQELIARVRPMSPPPKKKKLLRYLSCCIRL